MSQREKLEEIRTQICKQYGLQKYVDLTIGEKPARLYFVFEDNDKMGIYLNTTGAKLKAVFEIAKKYNLQRDGPKLDKIGGRFSLGFKLKSTG